MSADEDVHINQLIFTWPLFRSIVRMSAEKEEKAVQELVVLMKTELENHRKPTLKLSSSYNAPAMYCIVGGVVSCALKGLFGWH